MNFFDVAKAVARLHSRTKPVIHRDLKVSTVVRTSLGIKFWPYTEVTFVEGFCTQTVHLGPGLYITVVLSSVVAINRVPLYSCIDSTSSVIQRFAIFPMF